MLPSKNNEVGKMLGKVPPQAIDIEEAVLGALLLEKDAMITVSSILRHEHFYSNQHSLIYEAIESLFQQSKPIDTLSLVQQLKKVNKLDEVGGIVYLMGLTSKVMTSANIEYHAHILIEKWMAREAIQTGNDLIKKGFDDTEDAIDVLTTANANISKLINEGVGNKTLGLNDTLRTIIKDAENAQKRYLNGETRLGLTTGLTKLDEFTLGWSKGRLIIIGGTPGEGKTTLMVQSICNNILNGIPVGVISLEMSAKELVTKALSMQTGLNTHQLRKGALAAQDWDLLTSISDVMYDKPWYIHDNGGLRITELKAIAKMWKSKYDIQGLYVDYVQLMRGSLKAGNREQEISEITRELKAIAKELDIPVIALSQLNREMDKRPIDQRRPKLADLRESSSIAQDADIVLFVFRPYLHGIELDQQGNSTISLTEFIIQKHRDGALGTIEGEFEGHANRFKDERPTIIEQQPKKLARPSYYYDNNDKDVPF